MKNKQRCASRSGRELEWIDRRTNVTNKKIRAGGRGDVGVIVYWWLSGFKCAPRNSTITKHGSNHSDHTHCEVKVNHTCMAGIRFLLSAFYCVKIFSGVSRIAGTRDEKLSTLWLNSGTSGYNWKNSDFSFNKDGSKVKDEHTEHTNLFENICIYKNHIQKGGYSLLNWSF